MTQQNFALVNEILSTARFFGNPLLLQKYKRKIQPVLPFSQHDLGFLSLGKKEDSQRKKYILKQSTVWLGIVAVVVPEFLQRVYPLPSSLSLCLKQQQQAG